MPGRKKTIARKHTARTTVRKAAKTLARTWEEARGTLGDAEVAVRRRVRTLVRKSGTRRQEATETLLAWRARLERERRKAVKRLEQGLATLQTRTRRRRRDVARAIGDGVQGTLAVLNIPSRQEVHDLTRRVEELSRKIDGFRRTRSTRRVRVPAAAVHAEQA
jgi:hypothetical protein